MTDSTFKVIPKVDNYAIPFKLKENDLLDWLLKLSKHSAREACLLILQLIYALNQSKLTAKTRLSFLKICHEYSKQHINKLEGSFWDASFPLSAKDQDYAKTVTSSYLALAEGFFIAAQDSESRTEELFALYMVCYSLGQAQLHTDAVYEKLDESFWSLTYKVFFWAEKYKLLETEINSSDLKNKTLNPLFAQIIIFQNCDTTQFRPRDMRTIFNFLPTVCDNFSIYKLSDIKFQTDVLKTSYLQAVSNCIGNLPEKLAEKINHQEDLFAFDLNKNSPPCLFNQTHLLTTPSLRFFTAATAIENLERIINSGEMWGGILRSINQELFTRVLKTLEPGKKRKHDRSQAERTLLGVIGFENIASFLYKVSNKNNLKPDPVFTEIPSSYEELKLYADKRQPQMGVVSGMFEEIDFLSSSASESSIWNTKKSVDIVNRPISLKRLTILDSSTHGYSVHWADDEHSKAKINDIFGIISADKKRLEIAMIRRIAMSAEEDYKFGVEVLGFESEVVIITHADDPGVGGWGIFIPANKTLEQADSIIYHIESFRPGDIVYIHRQNKKIEAVLVRELNATSTIAHAELDYSFS